MPLRLWLEESLLRQRGMLFCWVPVCLAVGIGVYFNLRWEPGPFHLTVASSLAVVLFICGRWIGDAWRPLPFAISFILAGSLLASARAHTVAAPVLGWRYYGPIEGRIVGIDRSQSDALRLTLDHVRLSKVPPRKTPLRVRISLHGDRQADIAAEPGLTVMTTGHLSPPSGPVEPAGFDFQRHAWFARLGAVGYTRTPLLGAKQPDPEAFSLLVFKLRMKISAAIQARLPDDLGGFAAAITTGDRSAISQGALDALRASNLAHLLAISGLHMGLLAGVVYGGLRGGLALIPYAALRWPVRRWAALGALLAATFYLALSGGNIATERAFIMAAVALCAVMLNRRAISLRGVAIAATLVLLLRPEALMGPGFQMSFAATLGLVAVFAGLKNSPVLLGPRWLRPATTVVLSSLVAGLATAPVAAAHFNAIAHYGLIANVVSVPLMGVLVMPAAVLAALLAPVGLEWIGLELMGLGLRWILWVAETVAGWDGARGFVVGPGPAVLPLIALGCIFVVLWTDRLRWAGVLVVLAGFWLWQDVRRPDLLIADTGGLAGILRDDGRALSKENGAGFVARNWLENDGDASLQYIAARKWQQGQLGPYAVHHLSGKRAAASVTSCAAGTILVANTPWTGSAGPECYAFDPEKLSITGALAIYLEDGKLTIVSARQVTGTRLWTRWPKASRATGLAQAHTQ